ncbi:MAG: OmpH family outer membrane protein [Bacteroidota bacterium]
MKKSIIVLAVMLSVFVPNVLKAQKVGHVNFQEIILLMPEYKLAATEYDVYQLSLEDELKAVENMILEVQKNYAIESKKPQPNKTKLKIYETQNESYQQQYQMMQQSSQDSLKAKMAELVAPIRKKVEEAVAAIAKEKGYSHIIDNSYGALIYADEADNIDEAVKAKLNIKEKPAANPGAGKPQTPVSPR